MTDDLEPFITEISSGLTPCSDPDAGRLPPEVERELVGQLSALDRARALTVAHSQTYVVAGRRSLLSTAHPPATYHGADT